MVSIVNDQWTYIVLLSLFSDHLKPLYIWSCRLPGGSGVVEFALCLCDRIDAGLHYSDHLETTTEYDQSSFHGMPQLS